MVPRTTSKAVTDDLQSTDHRLETTGLPNMNGNSSVETGSSRLSYDCCSEAYNLHMRWCVQPLTLIPTPMDKFIKRRDAWETRYRLINLFTFFMWTGNTNGNSCTYAHVVNQSLSEHDLAILEESILLLVKSAVVSV